MSASIVTALFAKLLFGCMKAYWFVLVAAPAIFATLYLLKTLATLLRWLLYPLQFTSRVTFKFIKTQSVKILSQSERPFVRKCVGVRADFAPSLIGVNQACIANFEESFGPRTSSWS